MLATAARRASQRAVAPAAAALLQQERGMRLFELFSKEKRAERKRKLKEEMDRGYFDDFRDYRDKQGKMWAAPEKLVPASHAPRFPEIQVVLPDGRTATFAPTVAAEDGRCSSDSPSSSSSSSNGLHKAALVCVAFRAGAQPMLEEWARPFGERFAGSPDAAIYELSLVEGIVMRLPPFRQLLLREGSKQTDKYAMPVSYLFHFGGTEDLKAALQMTNLLTAYVYLVDSIGRVRWRGSGRPDERELATLLRCTQELLES